MTGPPNEPRPIEDWLVEAITAGYDPACLDCHRFTPPRRLPRWVTCARHAAQAVLDACRREDLFIMDREAADEVIRNAAERGPSRAGR